MKNLDASLTISRMSYNDGRKCIKIQVEDEGSSTCFLEIEIDLAGFTEAITGRSSIDFKMEVHNLKNVGKVIERSQIVFLIPDCNISKRKALAIEEAKKHTPEGWIASTYYSSQDSFFYKDSETWARTQIIRYVERSNDEKGN